ncbi:MAG: DNA primase catalytic subunit PriS [Archaeoglobus sp.]|nr:DNA primase catalytic subunit PriS [Archaeoglobus sp.]
MDDFTKAYLSKKFKEYYEKADLIPPPNFERREWAFVPFEKLPDFFMQRHISFGSLEELKAHILSSPPVHIFYSSACYTNPEEPMEKKGWLYADLIFDIDADHLPLKDKSMENALKVAKKEIIKLSETLQKDFGIAEKDMKIVFSGGRGYHIHVYDRDFQLLGSPERREIVDYLSINSPAEGRSLQIARIRRCVLAFFKNKDKKGELAEFLKKNGIRADKTKKALEILARDKELGKRFIRGEYDLKRISRGKKFQEMVSKLFETCASKHSIHIDAPVTADIKRLIRFPGSIHGKSGLKTMEVELNSIDDFDPFEDAIAFGDEKVKLTILPESDINVRMGGENFRFKAGEKVEAPEFVAIHLLCRGVARYGH